MADNIVRPAHYTAYSIEPIAVINSWGLNFNLGNVIKYVARAGKKRRTTPLQDLQKARQYLDFEIERIGTDERYSHHTSSKQGPDVDMQCQADATDTPDRDES